MNGRILTSCNVLTNFKDRNKLKKCLIESTIETLERQTTMEPLLLITNTTGTPITKKNFKKVSLCAKTITKNLSGGIGIKCLLVYLSKCQIFLWLQSVAHVTVLKKHMMNVATTGHTVEWKLHKNSSDV